MKKIKVFTNHYYPENFKINELTEELNKNFEVEVVTQTPNYPLGEFFEGYSWFKRNHEKLDNGIEVKRLPVISRRHNMFFLFLNYISYITSSFFYSFTTKDRADHVLVYVTSPIFIAWSGLRFARKSKVKSTLYLLDLWPGSLISTMNITNKNIINFLEKLCIKIYKKFDNIVVPSLGFIDVLEGYGISKSNIFYLPQHAEVNENITRKSKETDEIVEVVFTGNIGNAQGLDILVSTAKILDERGFDKFHFEIVGDGSYKPTLENDVITQGLEDYFTFTGYVNYKEIPKILSDNDFGFVSLLDYDIYNRTLPAKVQSYMTHGIPIIAAANGETPRVIKDAQCGYSVDSNDSQALADLILDLNNLSTKKLDRMSQNGYEYSKKHYNKTNIVKELIEIMKEGKL